MASVIYGMTHNTYRHSDNYVPAFDGWRRLRDGSMPAQDMIVFTVPDGLLLGLTSNTVAECLFVATNAPEMADIERYGRLAVWFAEAINSGNDWRWVEGAGQPTALNIGDTVTVEGQPSVACQKQGWKEIA